ncbi:Zinc finger CCHC domain-containing protein 9, partial [Varanus komodoensis]
KHLAGVMTRWARANVTHSKKALDATPWEDMRNDATSTSATNKKQSSSNRLSLKSTQGKKKNKKKKDYLNEDVNGFMEYLKQNSQVLHNGLVINNHEAKKEIATALKKDRRREERRVKRQEIKKNTMVCFHCRKPGHGVADCPAVLESQDMGTGICYRCGSTEHDISKCKVKIDPALGTFNNHNSVRENFHMQNVLFVVRQDIFQDHALIILKDFMLKEVHAGFADLWNTLKKIVQRIKTQVGVPEFIRRLSYE